MVFLRVVININYINVLYGIVVYTVQKSPKKLKKKFLYKRGLPCPIRTPVAVNQPSKRKQLTNNPRFSYDHSDKMRFIFARNVLLKHLQVIS